MLKIYDLSEFELKKLQHVRYWGKKFTTRQIFTMKVHRVSDFADNYGFKKSRLISFSSVEVTVFGVFVLLKKLDFESE